MKKFLIILLAIFCTTVPTFNNIDTFVRQDSELLVMDVPVDAFNTNIFYKIIC